MYLKVGSMLHIFKMLCPVSVAFPVDFFHPHMSQEKVKRILEDKLFEQRLQHPYLKITIMDRPAFIGQFFREIYQNAVFFYVLLS